MNKRYSMVAFFLFILVFASALIYYLMYKENPSTDIVFFGMGKADSILIRNKAETMLIDTGTKEERKLLANKLKKLGVDKIDYLLLTHPDKDHIGGAYYIIDNFQVQHLLQSKFEKGNKAELKLRASLNKTYLENTVITGIEDYKFKLGDLNVTIYPPIEDIYEKSNDYSLVTHIEDGDFNYLFAGDAEEVLLNELIKRELPTIDIYKVPHHGRWNTKSEEMIEKISPKFAVITNDMGDENLVKALEYNGGKVFYVFHKDLHFTSDGKTIKYP